MKFLRALLISQILFSLIFFGIAVGIVGAISFVTWELPSMDEVRNAGPVMLRVILTVSTIFSFAFLFSREGQAEWKL